MSIKVLVLEGSAYKSLRSNCLETVSILIKEFGYEKFVPFLQTVFEQFFRIQKFEIDYEVFDVQVHNLMTGWIRIITALRQNFVQFY